MSNSINSFDVTERNLSFWRRLAILLTGKVTISAPWWLLMDAIKRDNAHKPTTQGD